jgi:hypothetical protein
LKTSSANRKKYTIKSKVLTDCAGVVRE